MIFKHVALQEQGEFVYVLGGLEAGDDTYVVAAEALVAVTHVCRHWRQVALDAPALWTRIFNGDPERMAVFVERSRKAPYSLYLVTTTWMLSESFGTLPRDRLRRLDLMLIQPPHTHLGRSSFSTLVAPALECFTVDNSDDYHSSDPERLEWVRILEGKTDSLQALALCYIGGWAPSNAFPHLTHFHLTYCRDVETHTADLLVILANAPNLEFVYIGQQLDRPMDVKPSSPRPVVLSHLRSLTLNACSYKRATNLLKHLSLSEDCFVRLSEVVGEIDNPRPIATLTSLRRPTTLDIGISNEEMFLVADSPTSGVWMETRMGGGRIRDLWFLNLPSTITLSGITSLRICLIYGSTTFWSTFLRGLPALVELKVLSGCHDEDPEGTCPLATLCNVLSAEPVCLPSLRDLYIRELRFHSVVEHNLKLLYLTMVDMAAFRARSGRRLHRFHMRLRCRRQLEKLELFATHTAKIEDHVDDFRLTGDDLYLSPIELFNMRDVWHVVGSEKYWRLSERDQPTYPLLLTDGSGWRWNRRR